MAFDYLAFSEDVGFYVGRETFHGISKASLVWNLVRDLILYLYLQEQEAGLVVLFGLMLALLSDFFKIQRVLKPALVIRPRFPLFFIVTAPLRTPPAKATAKYDKEATSHLYLATFPMLFGVALLAGHDVHRTYCGWIVSSLGSKSITSLHHDDAPALYNRCSPSRTSRSGSSRTRSLTRSSTTSSPGS